MPSANPIADSLDAVNKAYEEISKTEVAHREDVIAALNAMPLHALVALAYDACEVIKKLGVNGYTYDIAMIEQHLECPGDTRCMWIVAQADKDGGFNKMEKAFGAIVEPKGDDGPRLSASLACFDSWTAAKGFLDAQPIGSQYNRIYPVVVTAGREPRTTKPLDEK